MPKMRSIDVLADHRTGTSGFRFADFRMPEMLRHRNLRGVDFPRNKCLYRASVVGSRQLVLSATREQRTYPFLDLSKRRRPQRKRLLNRRCLRPRPPNHGCPWIQTFPKEATVMLGRVHVFQGNRSPDAWGWVRSQAFPVRDRRGALATPAAARNNCRAFRAVQTASIERTARTAHRSRGGRCPPADYNQNSNRALRSQDGAPMARRRRAGCAD